MGERGAPEMGDQVEEPSGERKQMSGPDRHAALLTG